MLVSKLAVSQTYTQYVDFADEKVVEGDFYYAIEYYKRAMGIDSASVEINWKMAEAQRHYKNYVLAEYYYQKVYDKESAKIYPKSIYWLSSMQHYNGKYKESGRRWKVAKKTFKRKRKEYPYKKSMQEFRSCLWATKEASDTTDYLVKPIENEVINSQDSELAPFVFGDNFYFTSLKADSVKTNEELITDDYSLQIYASSLAGDEFGSPVQLKGVYKSGSHSANGCFSPDGKRFYFSRCNEDYQCKLFIGKVKDNQITDIDSLGEIINQADKITTMPNVAIIDGQEVLFFSSNREKTFGGLDIWYSIIKNGNQYSKPRNLGRQINSLDDEITPFYDTETNRLYFSSSWHQGFGGHDIFYSEKVKGNLGFLAPINVGLPINSSQNDTYFIVDNRHDKFYFSSNRIGSNSAKTPTCCNDIFVAELPKDKEPPPLYASLFDLNKKLPVTLYFHNDEPNPRTRDTLTNLTYMQSYDSYIEMVPKYKREYARGLPREEYEEAREDIGDFFVEYVEQGVSDLNEFTRLLLIELDKGYKIKVTVKGFASPLAKTDYNVNLTKRRINSLVNYLGIYKSKEFLPYLNHTATNGGSLTFVQIPFGEYTANKLISDNVNDKQNSVYSRKAALERKIEIQSVSLLIKDSTYAEMHFDSEIHDFGKSKKGEDLIHTFKFTNSGSDTLLIDRVELECNCTKAEASKKILLPGESATIGVILSTETFTGLTVKNVIIHSNTKSGTKVLSLTTETF
jgi:archaellum component FlaF (FlaF/FlaG flagellin family)